MEEKELKAYREAGKIAVEVREWSKNLIKGGTRLLDIAEKIEKKITDMGGGIAFPVNICINDITAHYTPKFNDESVIGENDIVTIDLGAHVDGYIADTAYTIDLSGRYEKMLSANRDALDKAIDLVKPNVSVSEIGKTVQKTLKDAGFKPIENLTGHEVKQYDLHAGLSIPNIEVPYKWKIKEGMVLAIEPFATDGYGRVIESKRAEIFSLQRIKPTRMREARMLLSEIERRKKLPFAERWFCKKINPIKLSLILRDLVSNEILNAHPVLHEKGKGMVSQFEHTMIVTEDGCEVITR
ncbi:MAG: type II methionyl aminopeptidase [Candidatus Altiarchaeales archaeon ex4484_43]|nr:MAG: type II methionyl aminopeptidase [Candidatus Altiarchaeales archaeon ex4484_43]